MKENTNTAKSSSLVTNIKTIAILLAICIVCGLLLALCNDLLYVDEETRFNRSIQKVYPNFVRDNDFSKTPNASYKQVAGLGSISNVYRSKDGTFILESVGTGGFSDGTVTMFVAVGGSVPNVKIKALVMTENVGQSWAGKVTQKELDKAYVGKKIVDLASVTYGNAYKVGGTTKTSTAILNSVKMAISYCVNALELASTPESDALGAVKTLLGTTAEGYSFATIDAQGYLTALSTDTDKLNFYFVGTKADADTIGAYVYGDKEKGYKIVVLKDTLGHTQRLDSSAIVAQSDNIGELVAKVQALSHYEHTIQQYVDTFIYEGNATIVEEHKTSSYGSVDRVASSADGTLVVRATGVGGYSDGTITLDVVIKDGQIKGWYVLSNVGQSYLNNVLNTPNYNEWYVGESISTEIALGNNVATGATAPYTSKAINNAINMACYYARSIAE